MMFDGFEEGIQKIWRNDEVSQKHYISVIGEQTRYLPLEAFQRFKAFFVPNDEYLKLYFGTSCAELQYELYGTDMICTVRNCIVFPCYSLSGRVIAWVAYNPFVKLSSIESNDFSRNFYSYPSKYIFQKSKYLFVLPEIYQKALEIGYLILTDGVFDCISFVHYGLCAASLLGSYLNSDTAFYLKFIPRIFVAVDNDDAGLKMLRSVHKYIPHAKAIKQGFCKDSDDILKTQRKEKYIEQIRRGIEQYTNITLR